MELLIKCALLESMDGDVFHGRLNEILDVNIIEVEKREIAVKKAILHSASLIT